MFTFALASFGGLGYAVTSVGLAAGSHSQRSPLTAKVLKAESLELEQAIAQEERALTEDGLKLQRSLKASINTLEHLVTSFRGYDYLGEDDALFGPDGAISLALKHDELADQDLHRAHESITQALAEKRKALAILKSIRPAPTVLKFSFNNLMVSFNRPAGLYGQNIGTTTESFSGTACGLHPLLAWWTIAVTNSYSPEGTIEPTFTVRVNFSKTNPFAVDPKELVTNGGATVLATARTTLTPIALSITPIALSMKVNIMLTGQFTPGAGNGSTQPIAVRRLPAGQSCP